MGFNDIGPWNWKMEIYQTELFKNMIRLRNFKSSNRLFTICSVFVCVFFQCERGKMVQLADLFSVLEIRLLCNVAEYFEKKQLDYHPEDLFRDVTVI